MSTRIREAMAMEVPSELDVRILASARCRSALSRRRSGSRRPLWWFVGSAAAALLFGGAVFMMYRQPAAPPRNDRGAYEALGWLYNDDWAEIDQENYALAAEINCGLAGANLAAIDLYAGY